MSHYEKDSSRISKEELGNDEDCSDSDKSILNFKENEVQFIPVDLHNGGSHAKHSRNLAESAKETINRHGKFKTFKSVYHLFNRNIAHLSTNIFGGQLNSSLHQCSATPNQQEKFLERTNSNNFGKPDIEGHSSKTKTCSFNDDYGIISNFKSSTSTCYEKNYSDHHELRNTKFLNRTSSNLPTKISMLDVTRKICYENDYCEQLRKVNRHEKAQNCLHSYHNSYEIKKVSRDFPKNRKCKNIHKKEKAIFHRPRRYKSEIKSQTDHQESKIPSLNLSETGLTSTELVPKRERCACCCTSSDNDLPQKHCNPLNQPRVFKCVKLKACPSNICEHNCVRQTIRKKYCLCVSRDDLSSKTPIQNTKKVYSTESLMNLTGTRKQVQIASHCDSLKIISLETLGPRDKCPENMGNCTCEQLTPKPKVQVLEQWKQLTPKTKEKVLEQLEQLTSKPEVEGIEEEVLEQSKLLIAKPKVEVLERLEQLTPKPKVQSLKQLEQLTPKPEEEVLEQWELLTPKLTLEFSEQSELVTPKPKAEVLKRLEQLIPETRVDIFEQLGQLTPKPEVETLKKFEQITPKPKVEVLKPFDQLASKPKVKVLEQLEQHTTKTEVELLEQLEQVTLKPTVEVLEQLIPKPAVEVLERSEQLTPKPEEVLKQWKNVTPKLTLEVSERTALVTQKPKVKVLEQLTPKRTVEDLERLEQLTSKKRVEILEQLGPLTPKPEVEALEKFEQITPKLEIEVLKPFEQLTLNPKEKVLEQLKQFTPKPTVDVFEQLGKSKTKLDTDSIDVCEYSEPFHKEFLSILTESEQKILVDYNILKPRESEIENRGRRNRNQCVPLDENFIDEHRMGQEYDRSETKSLKNSKKERINKRRSLDEMSKKGEYNDNKYHLEHPHRSVLAPIKFEVGPKSLINPDLLPPESAQTLLPSKLKSKPGCLKNLVNIGNDNSNIRDIRSKLVFHDYYVDVINETNEVQKSNTNKYVLKEFPSTQKSHRKEGKVKIKDSTYEMNLLEKKKKRNEFLRYYEKQRSDRMRRHFKNCSVPENFKFPIVHRTNSGLKIESFTEFVNSMLESLSDDEEVERKCSIIFGDKNTKVTSHEPQDSMFKLISEDEEMERKCSIIFGDKNIKVTSCKPNTSMFQTISEDEEKEERCLISFGDKNTKVTSCRSENSMFQTISEDQEMERKCSISFGNKGTKVASCEPKNSKFQIISEDEKVERKCSISSDNKNAKVTSCGPNNCKFQIISEDEEVERKCSISFDNKNTKVISCGPNNSKFQIISEDEEVERKCSISSDNKNTKVLSCGPKNYMVQTISEDEEMERKCSISFGNKNTKVISCEPMNTKVHTISEDEEMEGKCSIIFGNKNTKVISCGPKMSMLQTISEDEEMKGKCLISFGNENTKVKSCEPKHDIQNNKEKPFCPYGTDRFQYQVYYVKVDPDQNNKEAAENQENPETLETKDKTKRRFSFKKPNHNMFNWMKSIVKPKKTSQPSVEKRESVVIAENAAENLKKQNHCLHSKLRYHRKRTSRLCLDEKMYDQYALKGEKGYYREGDPVPVLKKIGSSEILEPDFGPEILGEEDEEKDMLTVSSENSLVLSRRKRIYERLEKYALYYYILYINSLNELDHLSVRSLSSIDLRTRCDSRPFFSTYYELGPDDLRVHVKKDLIGNPEPAVFKDEKYLECQNSQVKLTLMRGWKYWKQLNPKTAKIIDVDCTNRFSEIKICYERTKSDDDYEDPSCMCKYPQVCENIQLESSELSSIDILQADKALDTKGLCELCNSCKEKPDTCDDILKCLKYKICAKKRAENMKKIKNVQAVQFVHLPGMYGLSKKDSRRNRFERNRRLEKYIYLNQSSTDDIAKYIKRKRKNRKKRYTHIKSPEEETEELKLELTQTHFENIIEINNNVVRNSGYVRRR